MTTPTPRDRAVIAAAAADRLAAACEIPASLVGFDGFVDAIIHVVDRRRDMSPQGFEPIQNISQFAARIGAAAGKSTNIELVVREERFGGNGPLLASALGRLGSPVTYIGAVGDPGDHRKLHALYRPMLDRCRAVIPVAPPAHTDALEFEDGKIMLGQPANVQLVTWEKLLAVVGEEELIRLAAAAPLIGLVNWVMMAGVEGIWEGLITRILPEVVRRDPGRKRRIFIDLADPAKRTDADIARAMGSLERMNRIVPVTLGLNLAEAERIADVMGVQAFAGPEGGTIGAVVRTAAAVLRQRLNLACVVIHPREGAGAASMEDGRDHSAWIDGPFTNRPKLSTGAGDHFNGGFALGQILGMPLDEALALGCATSGAYVRDAASPDRARVVGFLRGLPQPETPAV
jgi:sugar/nucleoside kinase (ribokinase family)